MEKSPDEKKYEKIFFQLRRDEDGYPPDDWETLWGVEVDDGYFAIDSIPFFVRGIACGDVISVNREGDELHFDQLIRPSGHSVLRVIVFDENEVAGVRQRLQQMGCETEQSHIPKLISVDAPPAVSLDDVIEMLKDGESNGRWEYEEACIGTK